MFIFFALIHIVNCSTYSIISSIIEDVIDSDLYYLKYQISGNDQIISIYINFTQSYIHTEAPLQPEIVVIDESINFKHMYTYSVDILTTYISINHLPQQVNLLPSYFKFKIGPFQYPAVNNQFYESIFINDYQEQNFAVRETRAISNLLIYTDSTITSDSTTLYLEYEPKSKNFEFDVISLEFIQQYKSQIYFSSCEGISGYGKNTICWTENNFIYIQQDKSTFTQNLQKDKIKIKIIDFINPYYLGSTQVKFLLKDKKLLAQNYYSTFGDTQFLIKQQRNQPINIQHQNEQINSITQISFDFPVKVFNEILLIDLIYPNFEQKDYLIECVDPNLQIDSVTYMNYNNQKIKIKSQQKLIDYNIKLKIQNYLNSNIPTTQNFIYSIKEVFTSNSDQLKIQNGKGTIKFIPNEVIIKNIECSNYYIGQMTDVKITFQTDIVIQKFSFITLQFNNQLDLIDIQKQPNQINEKNNVKLFSIFDGVSQEYTIQFYNIKNPQTPQNLNFVNMQIYYQNYLISSNQNSKYIDIISGILKIQQANIYNIIDNSLTTMILYLEFHIIHTYLSDLVIIFDQNNINFKQLKQEVQCSLDEVYFNCQIFQDQLTIFDVQVKKKQYQLKIQYIPYPRSMQPLIIKSMKQINDTNILTQTENPYTINTDYYRYFEDFQLSSQQTIQIQKSIALNLIIIPSQTILQNEYLILTFNGYVELTQNSDCLINQFDVQIKCEFNDQFVKIIILTGQMEYSFNYILILQNIKLLKDFISLDLTAYTYDSYITQKSTCFQKFAQSTLSSQFPQFSFDPKDTLYYESSIYYLFFENLKTIPQGGYLELQMNDLNIDFLNGDIVSVSGNEKLKQTQIYRLLNSFSLKFYFQSDIQSGMHLFQLSNVINPSFNKKLDNYKFNLYSFDKQHNLLESQSYDLIINFKCQIDNCLICNQPMFCDKCAVNQITYYGKCIDQCPKGTVYSDGVCQRCNTPSSCLECSELDTVLCNLCSDGYTLINGFCKWIIEFSIDQTNNQTTTNNTQEQNTSQQTQQLINKDIYIPKKIIDINVFAIIVLSIVNLFLIKSILRKQTDLNNTILAISGITDQSLQFIVFAIILVNYSLTQSIISLVLIFISMIQQIYAYSTIKFHTTSDIDYYQNWNQYKLTKFIRVLYLSFDWKIIFIHKSRLSDSPAFNIKFDNEYRLGRVFKFLFSIKICVNLLNLMMLVVLLLQQNQIAQLIYESIAYNIALILIQMNKIYEINLFLKKISPLIDFNKYRIQCNLDQQEEQKKIVKITPESMIIQNADQL